MNQAQELVNSLQVLQIVAPALHSSLHLQVIVFLPSYVFLKKIFVLY